MHFLVEKFRLIVVLFLCVGCTNLNSSPIITVKDIRGEFSLCVINKKDRNLRQLFTNNKSIGIVSQESISDRLIMNVPSKGKNILREITTEGLILKNLFISKSDIINPVLSPDKKRIGFIQNKAIWVKEMEGEGLKKIGSLPSKILYYYGLNFSSEGNKLAFIGGEKSPFEANLWVIDCNDAKLIPLTSGDTIGFQDNSFPLSWSKKGNNILIVQLLKDRRKIGIVNVHTKRVKYLSIDINIDLYRPVWSPKEDEIAFIGYQGNESSNLWKFNLRNNTLTQLTKFDKKLKLAGEISYSPDGKQIAFVVFDGKNYNLWVANSDSRKVRKITNSIKKCKWDDYRYPIWSSDGKRIFCLNNRVFKMKIMKG